MPNPVIWYHHHRVERKRGGAPRRLAVPAPWLRAVQDRILRDVLSRADFGPHAHGSIRGRGPHTFAAPHVGRPVVLSLDLADHFPTVTLGRVADVFRSLGVSHATAETYARYCTDPTTRALPQGAPTSPAIANLATRALDVRLAVVASCWGLRYTRYVDDLAFSGPDFVEDADFNAFMDDVERAAAAEGFHVHPGKTRVMRAGGRQRLCGLVVRDGAPREPRELRRRLRAIAHETQRRREASHA